MFLDGNSSLPLQTSSLPLQTVTQMKRCRQQNRHYVPPPFLRDTNYFHQQKQVVQKTLHCTLCPTASMETQRKSMLIRNPLDVNTDPK